MQPRISQQLQKEAVAAGKNFFFFFFFLGKTTQQFKREAHFPKKGGGVAFATYVTSTFSKCSLWGKTKRFVK